MATARVYPMTAFRGCGWTTLARLRLPNGSYVTPAAISAVACKVQNQAGETTYSGSLTVANVIESALVDDDDRWTKDSTGYNFRYEVPASAFPAVGHARVEFTFTPTSGEVFALVYEGAVRSKSPVA